MVVIAREFFKWQRRDSLVTSQIFFQTCELIQTLLQRHSRSFLEVTDDPLSLKQRATFPAIGLFFECDTHAFAQHLRLLPSLGIQRSRFIFRFFRAETDIGSFERLKGRDFLPAEFLGKNERGGKSCT